MSEAITVLLVAWCLLLSLLTGKGLAYWWMLWREERRWNEAAAFYRKMVEEDFRRRFGILEAGK